MPGKTNYGRVKRAAYETYNGITEVTVTMTGQHQFQPGDLIAITTKESTK